MHDLCYVYRRPRDSGDSAPEIAFVRAKCWASQKKSTRYNQELVLEKSGKDAELLEVSWASCVGCPAGTDGGLCHHIFAVLEVMQYYGPIAPEAASLALPAAGRPLSVTSQKCSWGPRERNVDPQPIMQTFVERAKMDEERKKKALSCSLIGDNRGPKVQRTTAEGVSDLREALPEDCRLRWLLPQKRKAFTMVETVFRPTPSGSLLSHQLQKMPVIRPPQPPPSKFDEIVPQPDYHGEKNITFPALPFKETDSVKDLLSEECPISLKDAQDIERQTRGQRNDPTWLKYHTTTVTSSSFKKVAIAKKWTDSLLNDLFSVSDLGRVPAIRHGIEYEEIARKAYSQKMASDGRRVYVQPAGLVLHTRFQFIGASPDGIVFDESASPRFGLLEVKCPYTAFQLGFTVEQACASLPSFCCHVVDGKVQLKRNHAYYYQIQGQMAVCKAAWCDFVVWIGQSMSIQRVFFDKPFVLTMLRPLVTFYHTRARPYLLSKNTSLPRLPCQTTVDFDGSVFETLFPADFCQSRIQGRNGSNACTIISCLFVKEVLSQPELFTSPDIRKAAFESAMLQGNELYDKHVKDGYLSVDEVLSNIVEVQLQVSGEVFPGPDDHQMVTGLLSAAAGNDQLTGGVCVLNPYSFSISGCASSIIVADSHSHGPYGALLAVVPVEQFQCYFYYFWTKHYPFLGFSTGMQKRAHFSLLS